MGGAGPWEREMGGERKEEEEKRGMNESIFSQRRCRWWHRIRKGSGSGRGSINKCISTFPVLPIFSIICLHFFSLLSVITSTLVALSSSTCILLLPSIPASFQQFCVRHEIFWFERDQIATVVDLSRCNSHPQS